MSQMALLNDTPLRFGHTHSQFFFFFFKWSNKLNSIYGNTHSPVCSALLLQEHPLLRESAGILQDAWWENWKGKQAVMDFITRMFYQFPFFSFSFCHMGSGMTEWRIIPSLGPNLSKWGHNRWQDSDSKRQQSVPSSQRGYLGPSCWKHEALIAVKSLA